MKSYVKPTIEDVLLQPDEAIANPFSGGLPEVAGQNNGHGNGDQTAPGNSNDPNNAENSGNSGNGNSGNGNGGHRFE